MPDIAQQFFRRKTQVPTDLRTAEMSLLDRGLRERSFWSAGVDNARVLADVYRAVQGVVDGGSYASGRAAIIAALDKAGYAAPPTARGTLKDLRSMRRQDTLLRINAEMAQGYARLSRAQESLVLYPCWEFTRVYDRMRPRTDWPQRWRDAGGKIYAGRMIAPINDPVWQNLSVFYNPYPPFDYGSGMGVEEVSRDEAIDLGVIAPDDAADPAPEHSFNEQLSADIDAPAAVWQGIEAHFKGFAAREGNRLVFTDPNGTKPYPANRIPEIIGAKLPNIYGGEKSPNLQKDAYVEWVTHLERFKEPSASDVNEDVRRLINRIEPKSFDVLYRGMHFDSDDAFKQFIDSLNAGTYPQKNFYASFSKDQATAKRYAATKDAKAHSVMVELRDSKKGHDISYLEDAFKNDITHMAVKDGKNPQQFLEQREVVFTQKNFKIVTQTTKKIDGKNVVYLEVEESR